MIYRRLKRAIDKVALRLSILPKSKLGKAISYAINRWPNIETYLADGRVEICNNLVYAERGISEIGVDLEHSPAEAVANFRPLVEGVVEGSGDVAGGTVALAVIEDEAVEFVGNGQVAGAPDQLAAGGFVSRSNRCAGCRGRPVG
jgi:hypothetical protein